MTISLVLETHVCAATLVDWDTLTEKRNHRDINFISKSNVVKNVILTIEERIRQKLLF